VSIAALYLKVVSIQVGRKGWAKAKECDTFTAFPLYCPSMQEPIPSNRIVSCVDERENDDFVGKQIHPCVIHATTDSYA
jgi:hypothetical protein